MTDAAKMRAAVYDRVGPAREVLRLVDLPVPVPGPGEVRVRVAFSGINPSDVKTRLGLRTALLPFPEIVPHNDGAGVIDALGTEVDPARVGERVWIWNAGRGRAHGTAAEYVVVPSAQAVPLPDCVTLEAGACLGVPALTAAHTVGLAGGVRGMRVLVTGGAGAVGHYAVQMARLEGAAQVIATVSSAHKGALAEAAGADVHIDYRREDVAARVLEVTAGAGVDRAIEVDVAANAKATVEALRPNGDIVVYGSSVAEPQLPFAALVAKNVVLRFFIVYNLTAVDRAGAIEQITALLEDGALRHNIAARLPLARIAEAHELVESGTAVGNVVLDIDER